MTLQEDLQQLIHLQEVDNRLGEIKEKRAEVKQAILHVREPLTQLETERDRQIEEVTKLREEARGLELATQEFTEKIRKSQEKLSRIKTQEEYFALQKEIEGMERKKKEDEEKLLANMELLESSQNQRDELATQCQEEEANFRKKQEEMLADSTLFDSREKELNARRDEILRTIDRRHLAYYSKIFQHKSGPAVVQIIDGNCQGCHMTLPPQLFNNVRKGTSIITCSFCNRILYVENQVCQSES
ncbi:MAG: hypothetical protein GXP58_09830 [Deltaproteobacteria bacterium]|nr:hypothetical protein [Deltaproteobacteria bacterium]